MERLLQDSASSRRRWNRRPSLDEFTGAAGLPYSYTRTSNSLAYHSQEQDMSYGACCYCGISLTPRNTTPLTA